MINVLTFWSIMEYITNKWQIYLESKPEFNKIFLNFWPFLIIFQSSAVLVQKNIYVLTWGSAKRSVIVACLKLPILVKLELELSKFIVTGHSRSRFCFFSKHMANAHPTAWLRRSPWKKVNKQLTKCKQISEKDLIQNR